MQRHFFPIISSALIIIGYHIIIIISIIIVIVALPVLEQVVRGRQVRYPSVVQGLMEIGLVMVSAVVRAVVRPGRVQRRRVEVRVEHVGGRRRHGRHGRRLHRGRVLDGRVGRGRSSRRRRGLRRRARRHFPFRPASGQEVPQVRLVPAPGRRRLRLAAGRAGARGGRARGGGRQRAGQLFRVAEVTVRQARVQVAHFEVHGPLAQEIATFFLPVQKSTTSVHLHAVRPTFVFRLQRFRHTNIRVIEKNIKVSLDW